MGLYQQVWELLFMFAFLLYLFSKEGLKLICKEFQVNILLLIQHFDNVNLLLYIVFQHIITLSKSIN